MKSSRLLFYCLLLIQATAASPLSPTGSLYYYIPGSFTWDQARADAEIRGGHLATISSEAENEIIIQVSDTLTWIGGFQPPGSAEPSGGWQWVTGEPFELTRWRNGAPDNAGSGQAYLVFNFGGPGIWDDDYESVERGYVLEVVAPRPALGRPQIVNGFIVGVEIEDGGFGYSKVPTVTLKDGSGDGAVLVAVVENGRVTQIVIQNAGKNYSAETELSIAPPPYPPRRAIATAQVVDGVVTVITILDSGFGYEDAPVIKFSGGTGAGATALSTVEAGSISAITVISGGTGYMVPPRVVIASPPFAPELSTEVSRVLVRMKVVLGRKYLLEGSHDLKSWIAVIPVFTAEDENLVQEFEVGASGRFYRLNEVP